MGCNSLVSDIINACVKPIRGVEPLAYWSYRKDISFTYSNNVITAISVPALGSIQSSKFGLDAGHDYVSYENTPDGYKHKFSGVLQKTTVALDEMDDIVVFVKSNSGIWLGYGMEYGLWKSSQAKMSNDNLGTVAVEFTSRDGMEEAYQEYVVTADIDIIPKTTEYNVIAGLWMEDGSVTPQVVKISVDDSKICYFRLPDGTVLTSVAGIIDTTWTGTAGFVYLIFDKTTSLCTIGGVYANQVFVSNASTMIDISYTSFNEINIPNCSHIICEANTFLHKITAPKADTLDFFGCQFTASEIEDILKQAYDSGNIDGCINVAGGTNADYATWSFDAQNYTGALSIKGWEITFNEA